MSDLFDALVSTPDMDEAFSDGAALAAMLRFETALARAEARAGAIPESAAKAITSVDGSAFDARAIASQARESGTPAVAFVQSLTAAVAAKDRDAANFVHRGATSQDVTDTALVLCLHRARALLAATHTRTIAALRRLSNEHASTVMLGRTLLQAATPTTFGLKAAGWLGSLERSHESLSAAFDRALVLQFGGASGTLAALGSDGITIAELLARELDLPLPDAPWHAHRDRLASMVASCGVYAGTIAKAARDVALLMQSEIAEVSEPGGGSSTMPHKRNPAGCVAALAAASRVPGLVGTYLANMSQEHERGIGGLQAEWTTIAAAVSSTGAASAAIAGVFETLRVDPARMRRAIDETHGAIFAERAMMRLAPALGREKAARAIADGVAAAQRGESFAKGLLSNRDAFGALTAEERASLESPDAYLGAADLFRRRLTGEGGG